MIDYQRILADVRRGGFCDSGHYHCPLVRHDGAIIFPSGILRPDGSFRGAARLREELERDVVSATGPEMHGCGPCPHRS